MIISEYIKAILANTPEDILEVEFEIGSDDGLNVNDYSPNRIKFTVVRKSE